METLNKLLDKAREVCSSPSEQALADRLHVSRQTLHDWRKGNKAITNEHLAQVIALAHGSPAEAVQVRQQAAKSDHERALWRSIARQLSAAVLAVVAALPLTSQAAVSTGNSPAMPIMFWRWLTGRPAQRPRLCPVG